MNNSRKAGIWGLVTFGLLSYGIGCATTPKYETSHIKPVAIEVDSGEKKSNVPAKTTPSVKTISGRRVTNLDTSLTFEGIASKAPMYRGIIQERFGDLLCPSTIYKVSENEINLELKPVSIDYIMTTGNDYFEGYIIGDAVIPTNKVERMIKIMFDREEPYGHISGRELVNGRWFMLSFLKFMGRDLAKSMQPGTEMEIDPLLKVSYFYRHFNDFMDSYDEIGREGLEQQLNSIKVRNIKPKSN